MKKSLGCTTIMILMLGALTTPALAQDLDHYKKQVVTYMNQSQQIKKLQGFDFKYLNYGLKVGYIKIASQSYQDSIYELREGYVYAFVGTCDEDCRDLDFALYDPSGNKLAEDAGDDDTPVIWIFVTRPGRYTIRATSPKCNAPFGCYWAVQAMFK